MTSHNGGTLIAASIRDFFVSRNASEIEKSCYSLSLAARQEIPHAGDWQKVEFAFNRLFVGPGPIVAPPYASVYIDTEPFLMGETTLKIRKVYEMIGLRSPWNGTVPDDHISLELDACMWMRERLIQTDAPQIEALYDYFLVEHMAIWIPKFIAKVTGADDVPDPILWVCRQLSAWFACENVKNLKTKEGELIHGRMEP